MDVDTACRISQDSTIARVQLAVARKVLDSESEQGDAAVALIRAASGIQERLAAANGATGGVGGAGLDVYA